MKSLAKGIFFGFLVTPLLVLAQAGQGTGQAGQGTGQVGQGVAPSSSLENPLRSNDLMEFLQELLDVIMVFAVPLIVFMIIYAGFLYVTARGKETQVSNASRALLYAVIGGVIILGANIILAVISGTVDAFR
ncbi:hypothetical protein H6788_00455 [Candidatus Nomurabacteria bacterium]|nr:hypothetical protein [Candidatus Nomurabacteria bacterium]MCB9819444.1 hypothetical protein [Candidatus Nomurabacteria bacterium]